MSPIFGSNGFSSSMELNISYSLPKSSLSKPLPFILPYKSSKFLANPDVPRKTRLQIPLSSSYKSSFLGKILDIEQKGFDCSKFGRTHYRITPIRAAVKRRKEAPFDNVVQRDKKLKLVLKIRKILMTYPDGIMPLRELGKYRKELGVKRNRRFIALLRKFPGVFQIMEEGVYALNFKLAPEAERLHQEELKVRKEMEDLLVIKLRKLLMMSLDKRILLEKITHLRTDLGLPMDFRDSICHRYPEYFKVVATERGPALELTHWDPEIAVSAAELAEEENRARELEQKNLIIDRPMRFNRVQLPKGLNLSRGEMRRITQFRDLPYISPYSDFSDLKPGTPEKEKHACGVVHEILSMTVEKRTLVDHLTHFREEFRFSQQVRGMLIRHPDMFYVSLKGDRDSVFLREAYRNSQLIDKDRLLLIKEKMRTLVAIPRFPKRGDPRRILDGEAVNDGQRDGESEEEEEDWSDFDNEIADERDYDDNDDDEGGDYEDDWSDEDDDLPPDFGEDGDDSLNVRPGKRHSDSGAVSKKEEERVPVFPDGQPRERW